MAEPYQAGRSARVRKKQKREDIPMQPVQSGVSSCHYPSCTNSASFICSRCQQSFCQEHVHRRWGKATCEFCVLLEQAQGRQQQGARRILYIVAALLILSGIVFLILGGNNILAITLIIGGITTFGGAASSSRMSLSLGRTINGQTNAALQRHFNNPEDFIH